MNITYKKRIRLKNFGYKGCYRYFITLCTYNKNQIFKNVNLVKWLIDVLKDKSDFFGFKVWAYCFMPDHMHLLIEGKNCDSDMKKFVSAYKQYTGFFYKKQTNAPLWQINFYEHILRKAEDTMGVVRYIFANPVRKGLVDDYRNYRSIGSFEFDVRNL